MTEQKLTPYQQTVVGLLSEAGPLTSAEVAQRLSWKHSPTIDHLREARKSGAVGRTGLGCYVLWYVQADKERAHAMVEKRKQATRWRRDGKPRKVQTWADKKARIDRAHDSWGDAPPVHRRVSANDAPPIEVLGPVSVFALAQSLRSLCAA